MGSSDNRNLGRSDPRTFPSPFCPEQEPFYRATRIYLAFLQGLFAALPEGTYKWRPEIDETEILITDQAPISLEALGKTPAIVALRGPGISSDLGLDHLEGVSADGTERRHMDLIGCTMTLNCISDRSGPEAQRIAYGVYIGIKRWRRLLMRGTHIHMAGQQLQISSETPPGSLVAGDSEPGPVMVTVASPFFMQESWLFKDESEHEVLRSIELSLDILDPRSGVASAVEGDPDPASMRSVGYPDLFRSIRGPGGLRPPTVKGLKVLRQVVRTGGDETGGQ